MSESNQNEILLSAFLDGELTGDELKQVQDLIAVDAHARFLLQHWQEQRNTLKVLPPVELPRDLTADIMRRLSREGSVDVGPISTGSRKEWNGQSPTRSFNWRLSIGLVASLAALLLLALMLFQTGSSRQADMVASQKSVRDKEQAVSLPDSAFAALPQNDETNAVGISKNESNPSKSDSAEPMPKALETDSSSDSSTDSGMAGFQRDKTEPANSPAELKTSPSPAAGMRSDGAPTSKKMDASKLAAPTMENKSMEIKLAQAAGELRVSESPTPPRDRAHVSLLVDGVPADDLVKINQVFYIDFRSDEPPLAVVSEIFTRNQIAILNGGLSSSDLSSKDSQPALRNSKTSEGTSERALAAADGLGGEFSKEKALNELYEQSSGGMEALFVVATRTQLRHAMEDLVSRADVSGFEVSPSLVAEMKTTQSAEPSVADENPERESLMEDLIAKERGLAKGKNKIESIEDSKSQILVPLGGGKASPADGPAEALAGQPSLELKQAMAQQLRSPQRGDKQKSGIAEKSASPGGNHAEVNRDSLKRMILSDLHWRFAQAAVDGIEEETTPGSKPSDLVDRQEELVQFLLFIRTKPDK